MRPENPGRAPKARLWRALVRPGVVVHRSFRASCLRGFGSSPRSSSAARSRPAVRYFLDLSSVEPVPLCGTLHGFPYSRVFYNGVSAPPRGQQSSSIFSLPFVPTPGVRVQSVPVRPVCLSVYLTDPFLAGTPYSGGSYGSSLVCLHHESHRERQSFSYGVDSFIGNDRLTPSPLTRSSDNSSYPSRYSRLYLPCLLSAGAAHLTLGGLRRSPHLLPILYTSV